MTSDLVADTPWQRRRGPPQELEAMVADVIVETPERTTLVLFTETIGLSTAPDVFLTTDAHQIEALERFTAFLEEGDV